MFLVLFWICIYKYDMNEIVELIQVSHFLEF